MQYKTIVLELLQQTEKLYEQLCQSRTLLATVDRYAGELKASHEAWQTQLAQENPDQGPSQIASAALEMAVQHLETSLPSASLPTASETLSLDEAMAFVRRHTPPA